MPNHCNNTLYIQTSVPFSEFLKYKAPWDDDNRPDGYYLSFDKVVPMPKILRHTVSWSWSKRKFTIFGKEFSILRFDNIKNNILTSIALAVYGYSDWYNWCIANWWTKWDAYDVETTIEEDLWIGWDINSCTILFQTAWSPPIAYYEELFAFLLERDPSVQMDATYVEPGFAFCGTWDNGTDYPETWYSTHYCDEIDCDIISDEDNELISDIQRDDYSNLITLSEALEQIKDDPDIEQDRKEEILQELTEYFNS